MINKNIRTFLVNTSYGDPIKVERLLKNGMRTPDGTEIFSRSVHDYVTHEDANGEHYMVDGGNEYLRRSAGYKEEPVDLSVYVDEDHEINREYMTWGTYGKNGDQPLTLKKLCNMSTNHIEAILDTQRNIPVWKLELFELELAYRVADGLAEIKADKR